MTDSTYEEQEQPDSQDHRADDEQNVDSGYQAHDEQDESEENHCLSLRCLLTFHGRQGILRVQARLETFVTKKNPRPVSYGRSSKAYGGYILFALALAAAITVQPGQTLSGIASSHGVSLAAVEQANPQITNPDLIFAGQHVNLSGGGSSWVPAGHSQSPHSGYSAPSSHSAPVARPSYAHSVSPASVAPVYHHSATHPVYHQAIQRPASSGSGSSDITDIPGVPQSFVKCVAFRESTNGTNAAYNGGVYGIITASGHNVNGQSVSAQKQAFKEIYQTTGPRAWAADGCPGT